MTDCRHARGDSCRATGKRGSVYEHGRGDSRPSQFQEAPDRSEGISHRRNRERALANMRIAMDELDEAPSESANERAVRERAIAHLQIAIYEYEASE